MDDLRTLVTQAQAGDRDALDRLIVLSRPMVFSMAMQVSNYNHDDADTITQDALLLVFKKIQQLKDCRTYKGWVRMIVRRLVFNRTRKETFGSLPVGFDLPDNRVPSDSSFTDVHRAMNELKDTDRYALKSHYFHGHSVKEMATTEDVPVGTIKRRLHTARQRLREKLQDAEVSA